VNQSARPTLPGMALPRREEYSTNGRLGEALASIAATGILVESDDLKAFIEVALMHRSYVHEHSAEVAPVNAGTLEC